MLLFPHVSKLAKFSPAVNVGCVAAAAGERAAVTRSRQLAAPAHCTQLPPPAAAEMLDVVTTSTKLVS